MSDTYGGFASDLVLALFRRLEGSADPAWAVDERQRITFMNQSCLPALALAGRDAIGGECFALFQSLGARSQAQCKKNCAPMLAARAGAAPAMTLMRLRSAQPAARWLMCSFVPLGGGEDPFTLLHMAHDVTAMVEAWGLLSNYASRVSRGKYRSPVAGDAAGWPGGRAALPPLSAKEASVLQCISDNLSTGAIANELSLSPSTVRNYVKRIFAKLGVHSRLEAVSVLRAAQPM